jgi:hypothetical protein
MNENVFNLKKRVEVIEGIPVIDQMLLWQGRELSNSEYVTSLKPSDQLFLLVKQSPKEY